MDKDYTIKIISKGAKSTSGIYIGRGSEYGNPYPTKPSTFSDEIYTLSESLSLYKENVIPKLNLKPLIEKLEENEELTLSCFCVNTKMKSSDQNKKCRCHGELIAGEIFKQLELKLQKTKIVKLGMTGHANIEKANFISSQKEVDVAEKSFQGEFSFLSNMFLTKVKLDKELNEKFPYIDLDDKEYLSSEHAYQSQKSHDIQFKLEIANASSPYEAKKIGSKKYMMEKGYKIRDDWDEVKIEVMKAVIYFKFKQNPNLQKKLLLTEGKIEEKNTWNDTFWGTYKGIGDNNLGKILMDVRTELNPEKKQNQEYDFIIYKKSYKEISDMIDRFLMKEDINKEQLVLISGMARGADEIFAHYAMNNNLPLILSIPNSIKWHKERGFSRGIRAQAIKYDEILEYVKQRQINGCLYSKINEIRKEYKGKEYKYANFARNQNIIDESDYVISYKKSASVGTNDAIKAAQRDNKYYGNVCGIDNLTNLLSPLEIKYKQDIFNSKAHVLIQGCNCFNTMGAGIAKLIKQKYPQAYEVDQKTKKGDRTKLGNYTYADVNPENEPGKLKYVVNLYSQYNYGRNDSNFDIKAFEYGMDKIFTDFINKRKGDLKIIFAFPAIGLGLAKGKPEEVYSILKKLEKKYENQNISMQLYLHENDTFLNDKFRQFEKDPKKSIVYINHHKNLEVSIDF